MRLKTQIELAQVWFHGAIKIEPTQEDPKVGMVFRTSFTKEIAEQCGCRELIFAGNVPRSGAGEMKLDGDEIDCTVHFEHDNIAFTAVANEVGNYVVKFDGEGPSLYFRVKLTGYATTCAELVEKVKVDPLRITLKPAQLDLGLSEVKDGVAEGEPVDDADRLISQEQAAATTEADNDGPSLAPAALVGGTHQKKRGRPRKVEPIEGDPEPADDFMAESVQ